MRFFLVSLLTVGLAAATLRAEDKPAAKDESFAALDPENLKRAVECVVKRARSLLVVAHR